MKLTTYKIKHTDAQGNVKYWCTDEIKGHNLFADDERLQGVTEFSSAVAVAVAFEDAINLYGVEGFQVVKTREEL